MSLPPCHSPQLYSPVAVLYIDSKRGGTAMKPFTAIAIFVLALVGLGHVLRAVSSAELIIGGAVIPVWVSWPAGVIALLIAGMLWRETKQGT